MKLIIQIPCFNEAETLPVTLAELPRHIPGIDKIEWLIIDDGSADETAQIAQAHGVDHIIRHKKNKGLAAAFQTGINAALRLGADIIVNTDADNQYPGKYIPDLVGPILHQKADMVIGDRQTGKIAHFSPTKRFLQQLGSAAVRFVSGTNVPDAPSGFRAFSREAALRLNILTKYTYTLETIIQAGKSGLIIDHVPIETNETLRESRLFKSTEQYVLRSLMTILRLFVLYEAFKTFLIFSLPFIVGGSILWLRYLLIVLIGDAGRGAHVQSVIVGAACLIVGFVIILIGILAQLLSTNRQLHEKSLYLIRQMALSQHETPQHNKIITALQDGDSDKNA